MFTIWDPLGNPLILYRQPMTMGFTMLDTHLEYEKAHLKQVLECEFNQLSACMKNISECTWNIEIRGVHIEYFGSHLK